MKRRDFLKSIMAGAAVTQVPIPDVEEEIPKTKWLSKEDKGTFYQEYFHQSEPSDNVFWDENKRMFIEEVYVKKERRSRAR